MEPTAKAAKARLGDLVTLVNGRRVNVEQQVNMTYVARRAQSAQAAQEGRQQA